MGLFRADHRRTRSRQTAATVLVLVGQFVALVGLPLPVAARTEDAGPAELQCGCACRGTCGQTCCCSTGQAASNRATGDHTWHWVAGVQALKCQGHGPAGWTNLPPALPWVRPVLCDSELPDARPARPRSETTIVIPSRPPIPPPRCA
jgi:hypothetical protein